MQNAKRLRKYIQSISGSSKKETFQLQHLFVSWITKCFNFLIRLKTELRFMKWTLVITQGQSTHTCPIDLQQPYGHFPIYFHWYCRVTWAWPYVQIQQ